MIVSSDSMCRQLVLGAVCFVLLAPLGTGSAAGSEKVLHAFAGGADGNAPQAALIRGNDGSLYGTTAAGGSGTACNNGPYGCGTVFRLAPGGAETVLYAFGGGSDGAYPESNLVMDASGNLYGTTAEGGLGAGTVFKLAPDGTESMVYVFQGAPDGWVPLGNLVADSSGNLYGTTGGGGNTGGNECGEAGCGTAFKVAPDGTEMVLYAFQGGTDGFEPLGGVILDSQGNLYGTTVNGGSNGCNAFGCGTVFKLAPDGTETVLHAFQDGNDGSGPESAPIIDGSGNLFGTTVGGGASSGGTVFKLAPDGTETVLHAFNGGSDGDYPEAAVILDKAGNLFGTTYYGGSTACGGGGCGTVFELTANGQEKVLYVFHNKHGRYPTAALLPSAHGKLYGTTNQGGSYNDGVVFELKQ